MGPHGEAGADRGVGQHHVEILGGQRHQQLRGAGLAAHQVHALRQPQRRLDQPVRDQLRQDVGNAHDQPQRPSRGAPPHRVEHLAAEREDLIGEPVDDGPHLGQHQAPPRARDQRLAERFLEVPDLHAHGRRRQVQLGGGGGQGALADERPEVQEVVVVQPLHGASDVRQNQSISCKQSHFLIKRNRLQETLAVRRARCWSS